MKLGRMCAEHDVRDPVSITLRTSLFVSMLAIG